MVGLLGILTVLLIIVILVQVAKITELVAELKGEEKAEEESNNVNGWLMIILMVVGFAALIWSVASYYEHFLPEASSIHGVWIDDMFDITLLFTGIIFVLTNFLLFYFAFKYKGSSKRKALFYPDNYKLEIVWTAVPVVVLTGLILIGIYRWNQITSQPPEDAQVVEITGRQFSWIVRYPGSDGILGPRNFKIIDGTNMLGQIWDSTANQDDIIPSEIHLPVGKPISFRITARDVIHSVYLPHFRVKMDAVPGMPTQFWFTPTKTTEEMRKITGDENFNYELACAELCGKGHFSMKMNVIVEEEEKFNEWIAEQRPYYDMIKNTAGTEDIPAEENNNASEEPDEEPGSTENSVKSEDEEESTDKEEATEDKSVTASK